jgi:hypothetical protein
MRWRFVPSLLVALGFYWAALYMLIGDLVPGTGGTIRAFAWGGLESTSWGRVMAAAFLVFMGTLLLLGILRQLKSGRK